MSAYFFLSKSVQDHFFVAYLLLYISVSSHCYESTFLLLLRSVSKSRSASKTSSMRSDVFANEHLPNKVKVVKCNWVTENDAHPLNPLGHETLPIPCLYSQEAIHAHNHNFIDACCVSVTTQMAFVCRNMQVNDPKMSDTSFLGDGSDRN